MRWTTHKLVERETFALGQEDRQAAKVGHPPLATGRDELHHDHAEDRQVHAELMAAAPNDLLDRL